jgi:FkbM family methyltransferase
MKYKLIQIGSHCGRKTSLITSIVNLDSKSNAIFVEPVKEHFEKLEKYHNKIFGDNNFVHLNVACSDKSGKIDLYVPDIEFFSQEIEPLYIERGWVQWLDQLSSVHENHVKDHNIPYNIPIKKESYDALTIMDIVKTYEITELDLLFIDTEGHDYEILSALDLNVIKPKKIIFEHKHMEGTNLPIGEKYDKLIEKFISFGYKIINKNSEDTELQLN